MWMWMWMWMWMVELRGSSSEFNRNSFGNKIYKLRPLASKGHAWVSLAFQRPLKTF
jgi:hypothetical protein